jgi:ABC-type glycerol-3-phosphate transport system substrate-binding protein
MKNRSQLSRRDFLRISSYAMVGGALVACAPAAAPAPAQEAAAPQTCDPGDICIEPSPVQLPTEDVTYRWLDSGDTKAVFWREFFEKYQAAYPNITVQ